MIVYIAGPMSGIENHNRNAFDEAAEILTRRGFTALNPARLPSGMPDGKYMPICTAMVEAADAVYTLKDWPKSLGASVEVFYAMRQGKPITNDIDALNAFKD